MKTKTIYLNSQRAWSTKLNRNVAIKIINKDEAPRRFRDLFLPREINILKCLRHPRIIQTYDMFETSTPQNKVYIVTEAVDSGDLLDRIKVGLFVFIPVKYALFGCAPHLLYLLKRERLNFLNKIPV